MTQTLDFTAAAQQLAADNLTRSIKAASLYAGTKEFQTASCIQQFTKDVLESAVAKAILDPVDYVVISLPDGCKNAMHKDTLVFESFRQHFLVASKGNAIDVFPENEGKSLCIEMPGSLSRKIARSLGVTTTHLHYI